MNTGLITTIFSPQEMMYVWNGFTVVGKRPELTKNILTTLEEAEEELRENSSERKHIHQYVFFSSNMKLTAFSFMCRPIRVSPGRPVCYPAAQGPVFKTVGASGPG